jgi:DNA-binding LacI/PurR family transcriptional regulator
MTAAPTDHDGGAALATIEEDAPAAGSLSLQERARDRIAALIADGTLPAGSRLPPFRELARRLGTSVTPLQRAVRELAAAGLVEVRHGSGVRVVGPPPSVPAATTTTVAVISRLEQDDSRWKQRIVSALERELTALGHGALFFSQVAPNGEMLPLGDVLAEALASGRCGAVAVVEASADAADVESIGDRLAALERPSVWVSAGAAHRAPVNSVYYDSDWAGYVAARHLAEHGHRHLAVPTLAPEDWGDAVRAGHEQGWISERLAGVRRACRQFGMRLTELPVRPSDPEMAGMPPGPVFPFAEGLWDRSGERMARAFLDALRERADGPTALVAFNDATAVIALDRLAATGRRAPDDFSVVGFDNTEEGRLLRLSTVEPPIEELGQEAARALHHACSGAAPSAAVQHLLVKPRLIARGSVAAPPTRRTPAGDKVSPLPSAFAPL